MNKRPSRLNEREEKALALDEFVKAELARVKAVNAAKVARLKALRLARDEQNAAASQQSPERNAGFRKKLHLPRPE